MDTMEQKPGYPKRIPTGMRRSEAGGTFEIDPRKADGVRLALALHGTGRVSVREIAKIVAEHGLTDGKGAPLAPATMWRTLRNLQARRPAGCSASFEQKDGRMMS